MPPVAASVTVAVEPMHTPEAPVMVPALGNAITVIILLAVAVPHELVTL